jgi:hypothetical protein
MQNRFRLLLLAVSITCSPALVALPTWTAAQIEALGTALYEQDRRLTIAADFLADNYDPAAEGITDRVIDDRPGHTVIRYVRDGAHGPEAVLDAVFDELLLPSFTRPHDRRLTPAQRGQIAARRAVGPYLNQPCSKHFDSLVVPVPDGRGMLVYAIAVPDDPQMVVLGGHHRFWLDAQGTAVQQADDLAGACLSAPLSRLRATDGEHGVAIRTSASDRPLEIHVYLSLLYRIPLYVVTRDLRMWRVADGHMRVVREHPGPLSTAARDR